MFVANVTRHMFPQTIIYIMEIYILLAESYCPMCEIYTLTSMSDCTDTLFMFGR
jgi:hypothetical protein